MMTPLTAITTPDTVLAPGWAARSLTDVLRLDSAELSALVWACHWPCASLTNVARAVLTLPRSAVSWLTAPVPTLTSLRLSSEVRKAAALAHRSASGDAADAEAVADGVVPLAGVLADEVLPLDPHPAASSARPQVIMASSHRAAPFAMRGFISREATVRHQNAPHPSGTIPGPRPQPVALVLVVSCVWRERATLPQDESLHQPDNDSSRSCTSRSILEPEAPPEAIRKRYRQLWLLISLAGEVPNHS